MKRSHATVATEGGDSQPEKKSKTEHVVKLRGIPWEASETDIQSFFSPAMVTVGDVYFVLNRRGKETGECYVVLANEEDVQKALTLDRSCIGKRYIEVFVGRPEDLHRNITRCKGEVAYPGDLEMTRESENAKELAACSVRMRGLPYSTTAAEIVDFFKGLNVDEDSVTFTYNYHNRPSGEAYVRFRSNEEAAKALMHNRENIGSRYIELFPCTETEAVMTFSKRPKGERGDRRNHGNNNGAGSGSARAANFGEEPAVVAYEEPQQQQVVAHAEEPVGGAGAGQQSSRIPRVLSVHWIGRDMNPPTKPSNCTVHMRGLPYSCTYEEVERFFDGFDMMPSTISFGYNYQGRLTGEAYVRFMSPEGATGAVEKLTGKKIGKRYIELFPTA
mmetsp:Transcript_31201/g.87507  ORF Transcript_31201/g.87507 Transcript_31201/m.87507 type:complete len:388 (-) Transcript_31201:66-1229(-)